MPGLEFNQNINVAFGAEVVPQNGPEQSQPADMIAPAKGGDFISVNGDLSHCGDTGATSGQKISRRLQDSKPAAETNIRQHIAAFTARTHLRKNIKYTLITEQAKSKP